MVLWILFIDMITFITACILISLITESKRVIKLTDSLICDGQRPHESHIVLFMVPYFINSLKEFFWSLKCFPSFCTNLCVVPYRGIFVNKTNGFEHVFLLMYFLIYLRNFCFSIIISSSFFSQKIKIKNMTWRYFAVCCHICISFGSIMVLMCFLYLWSGC